jgi:hypothetical protein
MRSAGDPAGRGNDHGGVSFNERPKGALTSFGAERAQQLVIGLTHCILHWYIVAENLDTTAIFSFFQHTIERDFRGHGYYDSVRRNQKGHH